MGPLHSTNNRNRNSNRSAIRDTRHAIGFTLVELLVVMSLVALLIALLLPALQQSRMVARQILCVTNMKAVLFGETSYEADNRVISYRADVSGASYKTVQVWALWNSNSNIFSYMNISQPATTNQDNYGHRNSAMYCPDTPLDWRTQPVNVVTTTTYPRPLQEWLSNSKPSLNAGGTTNWNEFYNVNVKPRTDSINKPSNVIYHFEAVNNGSGIGYSDNYAVVINRNLMFSYHGLNPTMGYFDAHAQAWPGPGGTISDMNYNSSSTIFVPAVSLPAEGNGSAYPIADGLFDRG